MTDTTSPELGKVPVNRLASETSPYLRQHVSNPVAWQPWDDQALALAKNLQRPIVLSIGYSSCHWCHVMAKESFADDATAGVMNKHFINIKVDREERPDLDKVYQVAHHLLTQQQGGWPLTMFLDPDTLLPFFGGTYFPKTARHQLPSFVDLLLRVSEVFNNQREQLQEQSLKLQQVMQKMSNGGNAAEPEPPSTAELAAEVPGVTSLQAHRDATAINSAEDSAGPQFEDSELIELASTQLFKEYDVQHGGFGNAPKFPMPASVQRVLHDWAYKGHRGDRDNESLDRVLTTLTKMARGGIFDHLGGGFCRYSVDAQWMIPHFEKMLYDNGQLLTLYSAALRIGPDELFEQTLRQTAGWLIREMQHPQGGFYASVDADSEGEEGKFYVWRREQVKKLLTEDEYLIVETLYGLDKPANFANYWNLHRYDSWRSVVQRLSLSRPEADELLASAQTKLLAARQQRVAPGRDDKILTSWNALAIKGLAHAAQTLNEPGWLVAAQQAADFLHNECWQPETQTLYATWLNAPKYAGYLDDYANLLDALLTLLSAQWQERYAAFAISIADVLLQRFYDKDQGGLFFTEHNHETLIHRSKPSMDDALPPGNAAAASALAQLGHLLGRTDYLDAAYGTLAWARPSMEQYPAGHCGLVEALQQQLDGGTQILLRGPQAEMQVWQQGLAKGLQPWQQCFAIPYNDVQTLPEFLPTLVSSDDQGKVTAYLCQGLSCSAPVQSLEELKQLLANP
jgi:uncharacterized protein YyaL (SSP411 family)